jgi:hypothetical protein
MVTKESSIIERLIDKRGYDAVYKAVAAFVEENLDKLDLMYKSKLVEEPDAASLADLNIERTINEQTSGDKITFDVIVSAEIEIEETVSRNYETDGVTQWFKVACVVVLGDGIGSFNVGSVEVYEAQRRKKSWQ